MTIVGEMARSIDPKAWRRVDVLLAKAESGDWDNGLVAADYITEAEHEAAFSVAQARAIIGRTPIKSTGSAHSVM